MRVLHGTRRARFGLACVAAALVLNYALLTSAGPLAALPAWPLVRLAQQLEPADPNLAAMLHYLAATWGRLVWLVVGLGWAVCGLRARDLGLRWSGWKEALRATLALWAASEATLAAASAWQGGLEWNPLFHRLSPAATAAGAVYYVFGVALFEETFYRGLLVPQFFHFFRARFPGRAPALAVLVSQLFFAFSHLPHYSLPFPVLVGLAVLWFTGVLLALMWLRTGNLLMAVGWHGLMDLPYHLTAAPAGWPEGVTYLVGLLLLAVWPRAAARRAR